MSRESQKPSLSVGASNGPKGPFDSRWYVYRDEKTYGPYTGHQIRQLVANDQIDGSDLVVIEGQSSWVQAKDDPVLRLLFVPANKKDQGPSSRYTARRGRNINRVAAIMIIACLCWLAWPYYAVYDLAMGLRNGDEATLQSRVNWESVRQNLRGDLNASLLKGMNEEKNELGRGFALMLGPTFVNQIVDGYVTPQAVARLVKGTPTKESADSAFLPKPSEVQSGLKNFSAKQIAYAFFVGGPLSFKIDISPADSSKPGITTLFFKWNGDWSLTRVTLPLDEIQQWNNSDVKSPSPSPPTKGPSLREVPTVSNQPTPKEPSIKEVPTISDNSIPWGQMFKTQVERCWKKPYGGSESQKPEAAFSIRLKRDGSLEGMPVPEGAPATPYLRVYQESALRAIIECQPYKLPAPYYNEWKYFAPVFTEKSGAQ